MGDNTETVIPDVDFGALAGPDDPDPGVTAISTEASKVAEGAKWIAEAAKADVAERSELEDGPVFESTADMGPDHGEDPASDAPNPLRPRLGGPKAPTSTKKAPAKKAAARKAPAKKASGRK